MIPDPYKTFAQQRVPPHERGGLAPAPGSASECPICKGDGEINPPGTVDYPIVCPKCIGTGKSSGSPRSAWLIENGKTQGHGLKYMTFDPSIGMFVWTEDVYAALHLSRCRDAELLAQESEEAWRIVEHGFTDSPNNEIRRGDLSATNKPAGDSPLPASNG